MKIKYIVFILIALLLSSGILGGIYLNHRLELQRQFQKQEYDKQAQLKKQQEDRQRQIELDRAAGENYWKKLELDGRLNNIENSLQEQERDSQMQRDCESNGGSYAGSGTCVNR